MNAPLDHHSTPSPGRKPKSGGHGWLMVVCCLPMVAIAITLVTTGVISPSFLIVATACVLMMAVMMRGMGGSVHGRS
ncbi:MULTISPECIES: hypothetical protein [Streptomyces]|uniref:hypothetical protein n=1 Tax=Streptomyces TaxID=1883 RepID=UPI003635FFDF